MGYLFTREVQEGREIRAFMQTRGSAQNYLFCIYKGILYEVLCLNL